MSSRRKALFEFFVGALILPAIIGLTAFENPLWLFMIIPVAALISFIVIIAWCSLNILIGAYIWEWGNFSIAMSTIVIMLLLVGAALFTLLGPFFWGPGWWSLPCIVLGIILPIRLMLGERAYE